MSNSDLFRYISASATPYQAVAETEKRLSEAGYRCLTESTAWDIRPNGKYYVVRNGSSIIAFRIPEGKIPGFGIAAAHCDSPCLRIKDNAELKGNAAIRLSAELYGGMIRSTWLDRPLSAAGRVLVRTDSGVETRLVDLKEPCLVIPNVAIHMDRTVNDGKKWNPAVDLLPLYSTDSWQGSFSERIAAAAGVKREDILGSDLSVYNPQQGVEWNDLISAPRLDDLQCAYAVLTAFLSAKASRSCPVLCIFDNEEVGSMTKQGASSTFLQDVLLRVSEALGMSGSEYRMAVAGSFLCSCDNAHAVHPNHPEYADPNHTVRMNGGVVIKYNANQKYTSDAVSIAVFRRICEEAAVPVQVYANRADIPGGSTLGNLVNANVSLNAADIGLAQLAMHSAYETAGAKDTGYMIDALRAFYGKTICLTENGCYSITE